MLLFQQKEGRFRNVSAQAGPIFQREFRARGLVTDVVKPYIHAAGDAVTRVAMVFGHCSHRVSISIRVAPRWSLFLLQS